MKRAVNRAPIIPPMKENTVDIFCTDLEYSYFCDDFVKLKYTYETPLLVRGKTLVFI